VHAPVRSRVQIAFAALAAAFVVAWSFAAPAPSPRIATDASAVAAVSHIATVSARRPTPSRKSNDPQRDSEASIAHGGSLGSAVRAQSSGGPSTHAVKRLSLGTPPGTLSLSRRRSAIASVAEPCLHTSSIDHLPSSVALAPLPPARAPPARA
jgi:hypothetical protein